RDCAPLFLRADQEFIWGPDLKAALKALNDGYAALPDEERNKDIHEIAPKPPTEGDNLVTKLWDRHWPGWRNAPRVAETDGTGTWWQKQIPALTELLKSGGGRQPVACLPLEMIARKKSVHANRGSWWQVPETL